ncbi:MAG: hypothetical protein KAQ69_02110 [Spirochaetales bacterium]|nr:hypothetical protein [Spirochaetales bacterium]
MSLLGIDVGTTGCKSVAFTPDGTILATGYREYDIQSPLPGYAELDSAAVWQSIQETIASVTALCKDDPVQAVSVSSLGESVVPVSKERKILGPSILLNDNRGAEYLPLLSSLIDDEELYNITGNTLGNHYGITKLMWLREHDPVLYESTDYFLNWAGFVTFMLGGEPKVDFSLANRSLLFDINRENWSDHLLKISGIERAKLPDAVPSGTMIGEVSQTAGRKLGLSDGTILVAGAHDQCANALGCGVTTAGVGMYGMGTYLCLVPAYDFRKESVGMRALGLNTEHHSVPGHYVSFIYNQGGSLVKWFRDSLVLGGQAVSPEELKSIYRNLDGEMPEGPSSLLVLPHFSVTGPPDFLSDSSGLIAGLTLSTTRGDIFKGILEGATYYIMESVQNLSRVDIEINQLRAVGGGSRSDLWVQLTADILNRPIQRLEVTEAGCMGAAIMAGTACGAFSSMEHGAKAMVRIAREFAPDPHMHSRYMERFEFYQEIYPLFGAFLKKI